MREFQSKRHFRKMIYSRYTLAVLFILIVVLGNGVWNAYNKYQRSSLANEQSEHELSILKSRNENLKQLIALLSTQEGKEKEIREKFGLLKEGERMVVFIENKQATSNITTAKFNLWDWFVWLFR